MPLNLSNYKRISGLTEKTELENGDAFAVDNSEDAASQKITYASLRALLKTYFKLGSLTAGHYTAGASYAADLGLLDTQAYDTMAIINKILADFATVQNSSIASQAFTTGQFLVYNDQLYMVTADIAQGATISTSTNVTAITVGAALATASLALAAAYDSSAQYTVGDICTYAGSLYVCTGNTSGAWDSAKWVNKSVGQIIASLEAELDGKQDALTFDDAPVENSGNPVKSGGIYTAILTAAASAIAASLDAAVIAMIDGTNTTRVFKAWYERAAILAGSDATRWDLLSKYARLVAKAWEDKTYTLRSALATVSGDSSMTPLDDLALKSSGGQLAIETDAADPDDWTVEDPMTWYIRANAKSLADGTMNLTAIEGIDDDFDITGEDAPVWTFALALYIKEWSDTSYNYISFRTTAANGFAPDAADVGPDSNRRDLTWHPTFPGGLNSQGALTSGANRAPYINASANAGLTAARAMDAYEGLWTDCDTRWLLRMWQLRHWNLENSNIAEGCTNYNLDYTPALAETGVKRVLLTTAQAANLIVGSCVQLSASARGGAVTALAKIASIETVEVSGTSYGAVTLDVSATFNTTTSLHLCTMPYFSGATEALPGHADGCFGGSLTSGKGPLRVAGVEVLEGAYALGLDPLYNVTAGSESGKFNYAVHECKDSEKQAGSITSDYENTGISFANMPSGWQYVKSFVRTTKGVLFPESIGGGSTTYFKSAFAGTVSAGVRSPWRFCYLNAGGGAGLAGEAGNNAPSASHWGGRPRLGGAGKKRG